MSWERMFAISNRAARRDSGSTIIHLSRLALHQVDQVLDNVLVIWRERSAVACRFVKRNVAPEDVVIPRPAARTFGNRDKVSAADGAALQALDVDQLL